METKQTAVEWFIDNLKPLYPNIEEFKLIIGLAKDMEKEQIIEAHEQGCDDFLQERHYNAMYGKGYYNETYGKE